MFRKARIAILLYLMVLVVGGTWLTRARTTSWNEPLWVLVYPINADGSAVVASYIGSLDRETFAPIQVFFTEQAQAYGVNFDRPFVVNVAAGPKEHPPVPPEDENVLAIMWWSLKLRYYAWSVEREQSAPPADIRVFVLYHDPKNRRVLPHSLGLKEGLIGVVHAFASRRLTQMNHVVIAHEVLHTVGASDKYHAATAFPVFPDGFADPGKSPRYPQSRAELMGGRIPMSEGKATIPRSLDRVVVGPKTAGEIKWR